jgi:methionine synthase I (cobalamin-dependent)
MKLINFKYIDIKGKETERDLAVLHNPSDKYVGYDVGELTDEEVVQFAVEYDKLHSEFQEKIAGLVEKYDMRYKFRTFLEKSMSGIVSETI